MIELYDNTRVKGMREIKAGQIFRFKHFGVAGPWMRARQDAVQQPHPRKVGELHWTVDADRYYPATRSTVPPLAA